jgi:hypothetical protein
VVLILDSDRLFQNHRTANHEKAERAAKERIRVHVLELREVENYLPNRLLACLRRGTEFNKRLGALKTLTFEQRGYYDMKHGFQRTRAAGSASSKVVAPECTALYNGLPVATTQVLDIGFGEQVLINCLDHAGSLQPQDFDKIGVTEELRRLLTLIESVI